MYPGTKDGVIFVVVSLALSLFGAEAALGHVKRRAGLLVFRGALMLKVLLVASSLILATISIGVLFEGIKETIEYVELLVFLLLIVAAFYYWPVDITISRDRISATKWFGLWKKEIDWADVEYACEYPDEKCVKVLSKSGVAIEHTKFHLDRQYFKQEVGKHCWLPGSSPALRSAKK